MADKKLESITFPDLPDRYVVKPDIADVTGLQTALDGKADKEDVYNAFVTENLTGSIASFDDGADDIPVKSLVADIVPVQSGSGDPSPDNVRAISGWSECNVSVCGINFADLDSITHTVNATISVDKTTGEVSYTTSGGSGANGIAFMKTLPAGTYTINYTNANDDSRHGNEYYTLVLPFIPTGASGWSSDNAFCRSLLQTSEAHYREINNAIPYTFTAPKPFVFGLVCSYANGATGKFSNIMLNLGSTATTYEPYNGEVHTISFASAGTVYGGRLDVTSGVLTVDKAKIDLGDYTYTIAGSGRPMLDITQLSVPMKTYLNTEVADWTCSSYKVVNASNIADNNNAMCMINTSHVQLNDSANLNNKTPDEVKTFLSGKHLVYKVATPTTVQLTPTEVKSLLKNNNIWNDTGNVTVEYVADTKTFIENLVNA